MKRIYSIDFLKLVFAYAIYLNHALVKYVVKGQTFRLILNNIGISLTTTSQIVFYLISLTIYSVITLYLINKMIAWWKGKK